MRSASTWILFPNCWKKRCLHAPSVARHRCAWPPSQVSAPEYDYPPLNFAAFADSLKGAGLRSDDAVDLTVVWLNG
jgi:hypothetical protein